MVDFNTAFEDDAAAEIAALGGETITYTPAGGAGIEIEAIVPREVLPTDRNDDSDGTDVERILEGVTILLADVAVPVPGDKLTFDPTEVEGSSTVDWSVESVTSIGHGQATLRCKQSTIHTRSAGEFQEED